jgi:uncharacterized membrane protein
MLGIGRSAYGFAILGFGILSLGYVDFVHQLQPIPSFVPGYRLLALLTGAILTASGVAIITNARVYAVALVLAAMFTVSIVFLQIPSAFIDPSLLRSPWWIRTFELLALIGGGVILAGHAHHPARPIWVRNGRVAFGLALPVFGVLHLVYPESVAGLVPPWYPWPIFWAYFTGLAQCAGGLAIAVGVWPRLAATLAGVMYGSWALTLHIPRSLCRAFISCEFMDAPVGLQGSRAGLTSLFIAFGMSGSAWIVAGSLTKTEQEGSRDK